MSTRAKTGLILLILLAAALRMRGLFANTFHADEALFATWARLIATGRDPLLSSQLVDKPPLLFYLQALFYPLLGPVEWAARLPNYIAAILLIPLTGMLSWRLFRNDMVAMIAAAVIAISPLLTQFSATAYTDPLMATLVVLSIFLATGVIPSRAQNEGAAGKSMYRLAILSGLVFGLSLATKYQAILIIPLLAPLLYLLGWRRSLWLRWLLGACIILLGVATWELLRIDSPGIVGSQFSSYGGLRMIWSWELWPRLQAWTSLWRFLLGFSPLAMTFLVLTIPFFGLVSYIDDEFSKIEQLLAIFVIGYFVIHLLIAVPIWDRYLLLAAPFFSVLVARMLWRFYAYVKSLISSYLDSRRNGSRLIWLLPILLLALLIPDIVLSYRGEHPIGSSPDADGGIADVSTFLSDQTPGTVLYDHWYSWQWRYHLFDSNVYVSWFPSPSDLVEDLRVFGRQSDSRFLALPRSKEADPVVRAVQSAGFALEPALSAAGQSETMPIELYRIVVQ
ncbi:MAG TPA: glycosyltransferase family 39 protein [candidate division Zixibacteria bacterium]|nr:glycosyltransferase family 39 protein [candidate division Zixibacteria bacterium]